MIWSTYENKKYNNSTIIKIADDDSRASFIILYSSK
jgi:hypothetical protein